MDGCGAEVEIATRNVYRDYHYDSPGMSIGRQEI